MTAAIVELAKQCPNVSLTIRAGDLIDMVNYCVDKTRTDLEQQITDANTETYPTPAQVAKILQVDVSTLFRWKKKGYLTPVEIGGKRRYKMSDVKRVLNSNS